MTRLSPVLLLLFLGAALLRAETFAGKVADPSGAVIAGARVAAVSRLGIVARTATDAAGAFQISLPETAGVSLVITAPGFETKTIPVAQEIAITLAIAPQSDAVTVAGSTFDVPLSQQGSSVSVIPSEEIRERNESQAIDLIRYLPGLSVTATGPRGSDASLFIRGGDYDFNLVEIDGIPINWFGGPVDFAHIPTDFLDHVDVIRGAQSAIYGAYANSGVVNFVTRSPEQKVAFEALAEGGSHDERRFVLGGSGMLGGFGIGAFLSRLDDDGPVANSDYHNKNLFLTLTHHTGRQSFAANGNFNASDVGEPGPYGSDPVHLFTGIDLVSRSRANLSDYGAHYQIDVTPRVREEMYAGLFWNNSFYISPYGDSYNNNYRGQLEERAVVSVTSHYTTAFGYAFAREEVRNTYIDAATSVFPLERNQQGLYWENRFEFGGRLFINAGAREEIIQTGRVAADPVVGRPEFPRDTISKLNPKAAVAYAPREGTRLHVSAGTGIRPPSGFEIAFGNDNPHLKPERTASFDAGIEQRLFHNRVSLEGTYFYNRFYDLIVVLGGSLTHLSSFQSDNLANSRAQGGEFAVRIRPARWISVAGSYTLVDSEILSLNGSSNLAPHYFAVGQPLQRRPRHSGAMVATFSRGKLSANVTGYFRGKDFDVEPNYGPSAGLFYNPGFANFGLNVNYALLHGVTLYGNLRNALNRHYEEAFGFPSPLLNFVSGVKWTFSPAK